MVCSKIVSGSDGRQGSWLLQIERRIPKRGHGQAGRRQDVRCAVRGRHQVRRRARRHCRISGTSTVDGMAVVWLTSTVGDRWRRESGSPKALQQMAARGWRTSRWEYGGGLCEYAGERPQARRRVKRSFPSEARFTAISTIHAGCCKGQLACLPTDSRTQGFRGRIDERGRRG